MGGLNNLFTHVFQSRERKNQAGFEAAGRSRQRMLYICTRSHRRGISWSLTVCINTQGLSSHPPPPVSVCLRGESVRLLYLSWIEPLLIFPICRAPLPSAPLGLILNRRILGIVLRRGEDWTERERRGRKTETSDRGVNPGSGIRKTYYCEEFLDKRSHQMADVRCTGCRALTLMAVHTVLYVSKVFADDVSWVRHTRCALEMILSTLLSKLYRTVYSTPVEFGYNPTFISRFPSTHWRLRGVCVFRHWMVY